MANPVGERLAWYVNRLRAMSLPEIMWRIQQKRLQKKEKRRFGSRVNVASALLYHDLITAFGRGKLARRFRPQTIALSLDAASTAETAADMAITDWHISQLTGALWPDRWAYDLEYKQHDELGDARLSWEQHRHYHWPRLALNYRSTGEQAFLDELRAQTDSWTQQNPILYGIGWTSVMETAIRVIQWLLTAAILTDCNPDDDLSPDVERLLTGAANMAAYVADHRSRYSSANNHLLVELAAIGMAGIALNHHPWTALAINELNRELPLQFSKNGVNLEVSLHYHAFAMEAYLLMMRSMRRAGIKAPEEWRQAMSRSGRFVQASLTSSGAAIEFGDADGGKLTDLTGPGFNYYRYLLQLASAETETALTTFDTVEPTIAALYTPYETADARSAAPEQPGEIEIFDAQPRKASGDKPSGFCYLRADKGNTVVGIDCAPLGFGSIAAHGHADMLSFQLYQNGNPVLTDGGTYLYHCGLPDRNMRRSELMHNTICKAGHPQGEMRGPFLWGKRGQAVVERHATENGTLTLECSMRTADGTHWSRHFSLTADGALLTVTDTNLHPSDIATFIVAPGLEVTAAKNAVSFGDHTLTSDSGTISMEPVDVAPEYGHLLPATAIRLTDRTGEATVRITRKTHTNSYN